MTRVFGWRYTRQLLVGDDYNHAFGELLAIHPPGQANRPQVQYQLALLLYRLLYRAEPLDGAISTLLEDD